jgi:putative oxidoreductase
MKWFGCFATLLFGALFLWSGLIKVLDPLSFTDAVRNFRIVGDPYTVLVAMWIPWVEIIAGVAVMFDRWQRAGAAILVGALLVFTFAVILAWVRGLDISCGCFGEESDVNYPVKLLQNTLLISWGILLHGRARSGHALNEG